MNSVLKDDSPMGRLAVSLKQQISPCAGLKGQLVPKRAREEEESPRRPPPPQGSCRVPARGLPDGDGLSKAAAGQESGPAWVRDSCPAPGRPCRMITSRQSWEGQVQAPGPLLWVLLFPKQEGFPVAFPKEEGVFASRNVSDPRPDSPRDFWGTLSCSPSELV